MRPALVLCILALGLSACGGAAPRNSAEDFTGAERLVAVAIEDLESAARDDEPGVVCRRLLAESLLASLKKQGTNCTTAVEEAFDDADALDLTVDDVTISGDSATAKVTSGRNSSKKTDTLTLEKSGDAWRISSLQG